MIEQRAKTIDQHTIFEVSCDNCTNQEEFEVEDWGHLMDLMKDNKWKSKPTDEGWVNYCPDCREEI